MDQIEDIKRKIDVVSLISSYLTLKKAGKNYRACCPFHKEKTPSFMVSPDKQIWYCFGCNQGGDIFTFVEKIEGVDFVGALDLLAEKAGVILDRGNIAKKGEKDRYFKIMDLAARFFNFILTKHAGGKLARDYLIDERKVEEEMIGLFNVGYAPDSPVILRDFLVKKGFSEKDLESVGLLTKNYQGKMVDKFRDRIVFPIRGLNGKTIAFGGRVFKAPRNANFIPPKYLNSPQTDIYDKSSTLYGLFDAKESIREKDLAIIVEGYMDVISSRQAGVNNVVSPCGTALTERQLEVLSRYTDNIAFCFDSDEAGETATKRAFELTQFSDINIKAVKIEGAKDPDELIKKDPAAWQAVASDPIPILDFYYGVLLKKYSSNLNAENKKKIAKEFIPIIRNIGSEIEKAHWIKTISHDLGINEKFIIDALGKIKTTKSIVSEEEKKGGVLSIKLPKEILLMALLVLLPQRIDSFLEKIREEDLLEEKAKNLYKIIFNWHNSQKKESLNFEYVKSKTKNEEQKDLDLLFFLALGFFEGLEEKDSLKDIDDLIDAVIKGKKEKRKKEIELEISLLDRSKDREKVKTLLKELQSLI